MACAVVLVDSASSDDASTATAAATAIAEPEPEPEKVETAVLAKGRTAALSLRTKGATDVVSRRVVLEPGGRIGWQQYRGQVIATVAEGTLTRTLGDCTVVATKAGRAYLQPAGAKNVHLLENRGKAPVVLYVTYLLPAGAELAVKAKAPACAG
ncbi:MAG: cupin domain-containing protein [Sporichthyaceae bacterium]